MTNDPRLGPSHGKVVAICGGVGGAKLALGLQRMLGPDLSMVVNTGDDFEHLGLMISPDLDTVLYTLGGVSDEERGWGRANESWAFMQTLASLGGEAWFQLGDRDLALHVERTRRLRVGETLTQVAEAIAARFGIAAKILPMSDDPVRTTVVSDQGRLPFQRYFVEHRCQPVVQSLEFEGAGEARPSRAVLAALSDPALRAVVICPSNPYLSIDPILAVPGLARALAAVAAPVVAVSPIIGGKAVKGPTAKIMDELGVPKTSRAIARHYDGLIDGLVIDESDAVETERLGVPALATKTLMRDIADRENLARETLWFADRIAVVGVSHRESRRA